MLDILPSDTTPVYSFGKHDEVVIDGISYKPRNREPSGFVFVRSDGSGCAEGYTHAQLGEMAQEGRVIHVRDRFLPDAERRKLAVPDQLFHALSAKQHRKAKVTEAIALAFLELEREGRVKRTSKSIDAALPELKLKAAEYLAVPSEWDDSKIDKNTLLMPAKMSERTVRRHVSAFEKYGIAGLLGREAERGNRDSRLCAETRALMAQILTGYLDDSAPSIKQIHRNMEGRFEAENVRRAADGLPSLHCPAYESVRTAVKNLDPFQVAVARDGFDAARNKFAPVGKGLDLTRPLQRVEMDEWKVDLMTIMAESGLLHHLTGEDRELLGLDGSKARWWLTVAICATTRCILAMRLSRAASTKSAIQTLDMIMQDKGVWSDAVGALTPWHMSGTPELIVTDCGGAFKSYDTRLAAQNLSMRLEYAPAGLPQMRGRIERLFRTMAGSLMGRLTGRTFGDIIEKGDRDPAARAALSAEDICEALIRWVVDIYHRTPHEGLGGNTPLDTWDRLVAKYGVAPPPDLRRRRLVYGTLLNRGVDKTGITVFGVRYHSELLARWFLHAKDTCVDIRWYAEDLGAIAVEIDGEWIEVPAVFERFSGVKAHTWLAAARQLRASAKRTAALHEDVIFQAIADIEALNGTAMRRMGLLVQDWSKERVAKDEDRLFIGFGTAEERGHSAPASTSGWGEEVPSGAGTNPASGAAFKPADEKTSETPTSNKRHVRRRVDPPQGSLPSEDDDIIFGKK